MELVRETKYRALIYEVSCFQKCNFYLIPITSKLYSKIFLNQVILVLKFGCNRNQIKITFLESGNIIH